MESVIEMPAREEGNGGAGGLPQLGKDITAGEERFFLMMYIGLCEELCQELGRFLDGRAAAEESAF